MRWPPLGHSPVPGSTKVILNVEVIPLPFRSFAERNRTSLPLALAGRTARAINRFLAAVQHDPDRKGYNCLRDQRSGFGGTFSGSKLNESANVSRSRREFLSRRTQRSLEA